MSELRWILLGLAILVFIGTYIWSRSVKNNQGRDLFGGSPHLDKDMIYADDPLEIEEDFGVSEVRIIKPEALQNASTVESQVHSQQEFSADDHEINYDRDVEENVEMESDEESSEDSQFIVVLHVTAKPGQEFSGKKVCKTLEHLGLRHGKYKIYHRESLQNPDISLFSVANMVKPGFFDPDSIESFQTPGISFFLVLPGPPDPVTTFNEMIQTAKQVAQTLEGDLLDSDRSSFSSQRAQTIQDDIVNFVHRIEND